MSGNLLNRVLEHYSISHLRENPKQMASLRNAINAETRRGYFGAVKVEMLIAQHVRQFPFLKIPAELGTCTILRSFEQPISKRLEQVTVDGYFRRKCDIMAHLIDWDQHSVQTGVDKAPFVKMLTLTLQAVDEMCVWPLMILETFKHICRSKYRDFFIMESRMLWLAWLFIVEPVPSRYQRGGEREVNLSITELIFRKDQDELLVLPSNKISGRVKEKLLFPDIDQYLASVEYTAEPFEDVTISVDNASFEETLFGYKMTEEFMDSAMIYEDAMATGMLVLVPEMVNEMAMGEETMDQETMDGVTVDEEGMTEGATTEVAMTEETMVEETPTEVRKDDVRSPDEMAADNMITDNKTTNRSTLVNCDVGCDFYEHDDGYNGYEKSPRL
jgi:hypothetical protein